MVLGIIGEAGVGKSTAAFFFSSHGAYVISADLIVKYIYELAETKEMIKTNFGEKFLNDDSTINNLALRKYAFENYQFLTKLETLIWPKMKEIIITEIKAHQEEKLIVLDCAVLFNANLDQYVDKILLVTAEEHFKIKRIKMRDGVSENDAKILLNLQKKHLIVKQKIDFFIKNNGSEIDFVSKLSSLLSDLSK